MDVLDLFKQQVEEKQKDIYAQAAKEALLLAVKEIGPTKITIRELYELVNSKELKPHVADIRVSELFGGSSTQQSASSSTSISKNKGGRVRLSKENLRELQNAIYEVIRQNPGGLGMTDIVGRVQSSLTTFPVDVSRVRKAVKDLKDSEKIKQKGELRNTLYLPKAPPPAPGGPRPPRPAGAPGAS